MSDETCGTCKWWTLFAGCIEIGACRFPDERLPLIFQKDYMPIVRSGISRENADCPTWAPKEEGAK